MGQYRFYIGFSWLRCVFGFVYSKKYVLEFYFLFFNFGIGLTDGAHGFGIFKM